MFGVYGLFIIRRLKNPFVGELFALSILFVALSFLISLPHVIANIMLTGSSYTFLIDAFTKTAITVKLIVISAALACGLFVRDITIVTVNQLKQRFA